jgi:hypothetical protein
MTFEPCPSGDCTGKLMIPRASTSPPESPAHPATDRAYCPLCRQSYERHAGERGWQPADVQYA